MLSASVVPDLAEEINPRTTEEGILRDEELLKSHAVNTTEDQAFVYPHHSNKKAVAWNWMVQQLAQKLHVDLAPPQRLRLLMQRMEEPLRRWGYPASRLRRISERKEIQTAEFETLARLDPFWKPNPFVQSAEDLPMSSLERYDSLLERQTSDTFAFNDSFLPSLSDIAAVIYEGQAINTTLLEMTVYVEDEHYVRDRVHVNPICLTPTAEVGIRQAKWHGGDVEMAGLDWELCVNPVGYDSRQHERMEWWKRRPRPFEHVIYVDPVEARDSLLTTGVQNETKAEPPLDVLGLSREFMVDCRIDLFPAIDPTSRTQSVGFADNLTEHAAQWGTGFVEAAVDCASGSGDGREMEFWQLAMSTGTPVWWIHELNVIVRGVVTPEELDVLLESRVLSSDRREFVSADALARALHIDDGRYANGPGMVYD